eukprot:CAMPEP_0206039662 /NCGR_PEP_ID=MMETSP1466-20131121/4902_1 /ASSEMBLY_ACC=CAM_ASM_001126 /TAXON_ID=44452 /ORGANISM="Pavlova gyrans, Strain CCMP608" /LENGTH=581 /DNA_ID=CAMNT_0053414313 /DNA_START=65 /DNA_END=1811 /DNA_ORIENTATION=+
MAGAGSNCVLVVGFPDDAQVRFGALETMLHDACEDLPDISSMDIRKGYAIAYLKGDAPGDMEGDHGLTVRTSTRKSQSITVRVQIVPVGDDPDALAGAVGEALPPASTPVSRTRSRMPGLTVHVSRDARSGVGAPQCDSSGGVQPSSRTRSRDRGAKSGTPTPGVHGGCCAGCEGSVPPPAAAATGTEAATGVKHSRAETPRDSQAHTDADFPLERVEGPSVGPSADPSEVRGSRGHEGEGGGGRRVSKSEVDSGSRPNRIGLVYNCSRCGQAKKGHKCTLPVLGFGVLPLSGQVIPLQSAFDAYGRPLAQMHVPAQQAHPQPSLVLGTGQSTAPVIAASVAIPAAPPPAPYQPAPAATQPQMGQTPVGSTPVGPPRIVAVGPRGSGGEKRGRAKKARLRAPVQELAAPAARADAPFSAGPRATVQLAEMDLILSDLAFDEGLAGEVGAAGEPRPPPVITPEEGTAVTGRPPRAPGAGMGPGQVPSAAPTFGRITPSVLTPSGISPSMFSPSQLWQFMQNSPGRMTPSGLTPLLNMGANTTATPRHAALAPAAPSGPAPPVSLRTGGRPTVDATDRTTSST